MQKLRHRRKKMIRHISEDIDVFSSDSDEEWFSLNKRLKKVSQEWKSFSL